MSTIPPSRGSSRRTLFKASTTSAVAAATIVGIGPANAAAASPSDSPTKNRHSGKFRSPDPHHHSARTKATTHGRRGTDDVGITILPVDRAEFRAGGLFDLRVEVTGIDPVDTPVTIEVSGPDDSPAAILNDAPDRSSGNTDELIIEYPGLTYPSEGDYTVTVSVGDSDPVVDSVTHTTYSAGSGGAKNVIFCLGDGMGQGPITAARVLSKGIAEGKYFGKLEMDRMDYLGHVMTSGVEALATDSANSMSSYMTGHKTASSAMGVYPSSEEDPLGHPRVETIAELIRRTTNKSLGIVTTAAIQDATPAAVFAHTRFRDEAQAIMDQSLEKGQMPDVFMGGGLEYLLPQDDEDSARDDDRDLRIEFEDEGFSHATTRSELEKVMDEGTPEKLLGTFHHATMDVYLDRQHMKDPDELGEWDDQPNLMEMTRAALKVLEQNDDGFFLMVEGASIDKMNHPMDGPRAVYDTIEFDQAIGIAKEWAAEHGDTLVVVTADHNHSMQVVGTHDKSDGEGREANGIYGDATYPTYEDTTGDGFPDDPDPDVQLFFGWSSHPDHTDDFIHNETFKPAAVVDEETDEAIPNPERDPDADLQEGNLAHPLTTCVHTVDDVMIAASGPGSEKFNGVIDNTEVFHYLIDAYGIDATENVD